MSLLLNIRQGEAAYVASALLKHPEVFQQQDFWSVFETALRATQGTAETLRTNILELSSLLYPFVVAVKPDLLARLTDMLSINGVANDRIHLALLVANASVEVARNSSAYELSSGLTAQLYETEIDGLRCSDLRLPYAAVAITCPSLPTEIYLPDPQSSEEVEEEMDLSGIMIQEQARVWTIIYDLYSRKNGRHASIAVDQLNLSEDSQALTDATMASGSGQAPDASEATKFTRLLRFVTNTVLYMTWPDAEVDHVILNPHARKLWAKIEKMPHCKHRNRLQAMLDKMNTQRGCLLGKSVIYVSRQKVMSDDHVAGRNTGAKLLAYQRIPGFWRNQPWGPRNSLRRRQWIQPYVRGPKDGVLATPLHKLILREGA